MKSRVASQCEAATGKMCCIVTIGMLSLEFAVRRMRRIPHFVSYADWLVNGCCAELFRSKLTSSTFHAASEFGMREHSRIPPLL
ncbi:hypothetical protein NDU88_001615 [Pleurodeles waltl]|uniref:Uncharacterized protein n=1 Tax=Pleurodeles waltl TaxID=8319 RepID=A0AAV7M0Z3_PLEWA|nr:hypothetical protein NDU88_001615 [Pleurodeles waltl]